MSVNMVADYKNKKVYAQIDRLERQSRRAVRQGFFRLGNDLKETSRRLIIDPPKTGRLYRISGRKRKHRASAPGQPPANMTGSLQRSISFKIKGAESMEFGSNPQKSDSAKKTWLYARRLEVGDARIARRPYLEPSVRKNARNGRKHFESELRKELK